jgi:hypothetical protein
MLPGTDGAGSCWGRLTSMHRGLEVPSCGAVPGFGEPRGAIGGVLGVYR